MGRRASRRRSAGQTVKAPAHVMATQGTVTNPYVWVTWDRNDPTVTKYEVLRDGAVIATIGPFVPYDWTNAAHKTWYTGGAGTGGYTSEVLADSPSYYFRLEQSGA